MAISNYPDFEENNANMISKASVKAIMCIGLYVFVQSFTPNVLAIRITSSVENGMMGEHGSPRIENYVDKMGLENEIFENIDDVGPVYDTKLTEPEISPEELPNLIVLLGNSVKTRNIKRGNTEAEKHNLQALPEPPCDCEYSIVNINLGDNYFPQILRNRTCDDQMCADSYRCQSNVYELTVLKRRRHFEESQVQVPTDLRHRWVAEKKKITTGCMCTKDYVAN